MSGSWREAWKTEYFFLESAPAQTKASSFSEQCSRHQSTGFSKKERDWLNWGRFARMTCAGHLPQGCLNRDVIFLFFNELWGIPLSPQRPDMTIAEKPAAKRFANTWMCFFEPQKTEAHENKGEIF